MTAPQAFACTIFLAGMSATWGAALAPGQERGTYLEIRISKSPPPSGVPLPVAELFDRFFSAYSEQMREQLRDGGSFLWEYRVALEQVPGRTAYRIALTAIGGQMHVKIGSYPVKTSVRRIREVVRRSAAISNDPILSAMAAGKDSVSEGLMPEIRRK